jgi:ElaB/YqjD/DUF883 family membrane-anchored ribosome-binding protein
MKSFDLVYKIEEASSWRDKEAIKIKSNLADDVMVECELSKSLVDYLKTEAVVLDPDKFLLTIAEAQKREIQTNIESLDDMAIQAKIHADRAHEILSTIAEEARQRYDEIEKNFSDTEKRFNDKMKSTTEKIKQDLAILTSVEEKLVAIDSWQLVKLAEAVEQIIMLTETDPELVKLVLKYKKS